MEESTVQHLKEVLKEFDTVMFVTRAADGAARARPMAIAELGADAHAYFVTSTDSAKSAEISAMPTVTLTCQSANQFVSLSGRAAVVHDPRLVQRLWKEAWKLWFPKGSGDPSVALIRFDAEEGEYWDNAGAQGLKYLFRAAKALAAGETPKTDEQQHAKVLL